MTNSTVNKNENTLQSRIEDIEFKLYALRLQVYNLEKQQDQIELDPDEYEDQFNESLDESIPEIEIGCLTYLPSHVCLPHARGGVSSVINTITVSTASSPRPWGCFRR